MNTKEQQMIKTPISPHSIHERKYTSLLLLLFVHVMSCHVMSCHVTSHHITSCHLISVMFFFILFSFLIFEYTDLELSHRGLLAEQLLGPTHAELGPPWLHRSSTGWQHAPGHRWTDGGQGHRTGPGTHPSCCGYTALQESPSTGLMAAPSQVLQNMADAVVITQARCIAGPKMAQLAVKLLCCGLHQTRILDQTHEHH